MQSWSSVSLGGRGYSQRLAPWKLPTSLSLHYRQAHQAPQPVHAHCIVSFARYSDAFMLSYRRILCFGPKCLSIFGHHVSHINLFIDS